ncbi:MAG: tetratricopeptide repeat protein [Candidatus Hodarchaeales archaeon]|jgi:tetratricopeptide (TPR) repeat protein
MITSIPDEIERAWQVFNEGEAETALQIITKLEKQEDISQEDHLKCQIAEGIINYYLGNFEKTINLSNLTYQESLKLDKPLLSIDAIFNKWLAQFWVARLDLNSGSTLIKDCENMLKSASEEPIAKIKQREAKIYFLKGVIYIYMTCEYDLALINFRKSLEIFERHHTQLYLLVLSLLFIGEAYSFIGELKKGLKYQKRSLELSNERYLMNKVIKGATLYDIGKIYYELGDLEKAIKSFEEALSVIGNIQGVGYLGYSYAKLIKIYLDKGSIDRAKEFLLAFQGYNEKQKIRAGNMPNTRFFKLSKARVLRASTRTRNWTEAEKILTDIIKEYDSVKLNYNLPDELVDPIIELCDFYLHELQLTNDLAILKDIQPYIKRLIKESERTNSYSLRAMTYLLQGKLAVLQMNMGDARKYLTKAQKIADKNGLHLLARAISKEHDEFLGRLEEWENFKNRNAPMSERMKLISLEETIERMQGKRALEKKKQVNEEPLLLLIIIEGGVLVFSYPFSDGWDRDNELFGSFMSAFTTFSDEFFSEELDRVKFGQYTVILEVIDNFSICYVFKGHSYLAKQKLARFTNRIKSQKIILETLNKFYQTSQVMESKDFPFLEAFITEIFQSL